MVDVLILLGLGVWLFAVCDVVATEPSRVRLLPKPAWFVLTVLLPGVGLLLWHLLGRPRTNAAGGRSRGTSRDPGRGRGGATGFSRPAAPGRPRKPGRRPGRQQPTVIPLHDQQPVGIEEANARRARSEELNRKLEEWEAQQRRNESGSGGGSAERQQRR